MLTQTFSTDGRVPLSDLYSTYLRLESDYGFSKHIIYTIEGTDVYAFISPAKSDKVLYLLSGVHGEEPSGPNAIAESIDTIGKLGQTTSLLVAPLLNPKGYSRGTRYFDSTLTKGGNSVSDSEHVLNGTPPSSDIAVSVTDFFLRQLKSLPPTLTIDIHEDELLEQKGYIYSQGEMADADPVAKKAVQILIDSGLEIYNSGTTRFDEPIKNGIVISSDGGPVKDGSIDELLATVAKTSLVIETPTLGGVTLADRISADKAIITHLQDLLN